MYDHNSIDVDKACDTSSAALKSAMDKVEREIKESICCEYTPEELRALALLIAINKPEVLQSLLVLLVNGIDNNKKYTSYSKLVETVEPYLLDNIAVVLVTTILIMNGK